MVMMTSETRTSRFFSKFDCEIPTQLTIDRVAKADVSPEGRGEMKFVVHWQEPDEKPMVLNPTNAERIGEAIREHDMAKWGGVKVELYHDPNISYAGKIVGGIRVKTAFRPANFGDEIP